jgi:hypothetical protein
MPLTDSESNITLNLARYYPYTLLVSAEIKSQTRTLVFTILLLYVTIAKQRGLYIKPTSHQKAVEFITYCYPSFFVCCSLEYITTILKFLQDYPTLSQGTQSLPLSWRIKFQLRHSYQIHLNRMWEYSIYFPHIFYILSTHLWLLICKHSHITELSTLNNTNDNMLLSFVIVT